MSLFPRRVRLCCVARMENLKRFLVALEYPNTEVFNIDDRASVVFLVEWLEDRKIRELDIGDRTPLRGDGLSWDEAFASYLNTLGSPFEWPGDGVVDCITWLVSHALAVEYEEIASECVGAEENKEAMDVENSSNDRCDSSSVNELGDLLKLPRLKGEGDVEYLGRIKSKLKLTLSPSARACVLEQKYLMDIANLPLGFSTNDAAVDKIAVVLKMLYLADLKELQLDLNSLIVLGQEFTANPKTNSALGKVGR